MITREHSDRVCGSCTECCMVLGIPELNKEPRSRCPSMMRGIGCGVYGSRPDSCRAYRCVWLEGYGPKTHRPDRSGVIFEFNQVKDPKQPFVVARECFTGASREKKGKMVIDAWAEILPVVIVPHKPEADFRLYYMGNDRDVRSNLDRIIRTYSQDPHKSQ